MSGTSPVAPTSTEISQQLLNELDQLVLMVVLCLDVLRRNSLQAEGLPGLYPLPAAERRHPGPGGEGEDHTRGSTRLPGPLQQLRLALPEPGPLRGESHRLPLRLRPVGVHRSLLPLRYTNTKDLLLSAQTYIYSVSGC